MCRSNMKVICNVWFILCTSASKKVIPVCLNLNSVKIIKGINEFYKFGIGIEVRDEAGYIPMKVYEVNLVYSLYCTRYWCRNIQSNKAGSPIGDDCYKETLDVWSCYMLWWQTRALQTLVPDKDTPNPFTWQGHSKPLYLTHLDLDGGDTSLPVELEAT